MKHAAIAIFGFIVGLSLVAAGIWFNPLTASNRPVPVDATAGTATELFYAADTRNAIAYTNSGNAYLPRVPTDIEELWNPTLQGVHAGVYSLTDAAERVVGIGVKFAALAEDTRPLTGELLLDSSWNIYLPGVGSAFVDQRENYWPLIRSVVVPAALNGERKWSGEFETDLTVGPEATLEARVIGSTGVLRGQRGDAREAIMAAGYSLEVQHTSGSVDGRRSLLLSMR